MSSIMQSIFDCISSFITNWADAAGATASDNAIANILQCFMVFFVSGLQRYIKNRVFYILLYRFHSSADMISRYIFFAALMATAISAAGAAPEIPDISPGQRDSADSTVAVELPPPALPPIYTAPDTYVPTCLLSDEDIARRIAFSTPHYTPVIASWQNGAIWADGSAIHFPGMAGVESATAGISQRIGRVSLSAYGTATKYGYFRGLSTQWTVGGSLQWQFAPRLGITLFGSYSTGAYRIGMAPGVAEMLAMPSFGGYLSWDITDKFGVDVGASATYNNLGRWEARPIVAPYLRTGSAKISVDVGGIMYELLRSSSSSNPRNPTVGPPKPIIPIAPRD